VIGITKNRQMNKGRIIAHIGRTIPDCIIMSGTKQGLGRSNSACRHVL
jgi:hypothetical protein